jgi:dTDP-4-dehydrorhamnose reductase
MRVLVVGTSGQLATELHRQARALSDGALHVVEPQRVDIGQREASWKLLDDARPDVVVNAAAYTAVDRAETDEAAAFRVNSDGPRYLAEWCQTYDAALVHVSTDYVFDGSKPTPYVETDATSPLNVYGRSKLAGEEAVRAALARHVIVRTSWVFSAHGQNFVKTMLRLARERDELRVVADQHGRPTSAADLASALLGICRALAQPDSTSAYGTFHFANRGEATWHALAEAVVILQESQTGRRPRVLPITTADYPTPAARPRNSVLSSSKVEQTFGFTPRHWQEALGPVVEELLRTS